MKLRNTVSNWDHLKPFLPPGSTQKIVFLGAASFLGGLAESAVLVLMTLSADALIRGVDHLEVAGMDISHVQAVMIALTLIVLRVFTTLTASQAAGRFAARTMASAQFSLLSAFVNSSYAAKASRVGGDLTGVTVSNGRFTGDLAGAYASAAGAVCGLLAFGITSVVVNPVATFGVAAVGGLLLVLMRPLRTKAQRAARDYAEVARNLGREVTQVEVLRREIELFRVGDPVLHKLKDEIDEGGRRSQRVLVIGAVIPQLFQAALLTTAVLGLLAIANSSGGHSFGALGAVVLLLVRSMGSAQQLVTANQKIVASGAHTAGLGRLLDELRAEVREFGIQRPQRMTPLRLDSVSFSYGGETNVLEDLNVEFESGELVGIVGPSGAGKSTLVELLLRLRSPTVGSVSCGGVPIDDIHPAEFANRVAFVPQQPALLAGSIAENVDFFRGLPEARIRSALEEAHLSDAIEELPNGIHTNLGADERALSGGQQQRLTIARALAGDPEILVLDEPTSALDAISEKAVRMTLEELPTGRTVLVIAHRYSTLRSCSRILVFRKGRLEVDASPGEVAEQSDFFRAMVGEDSEAQ